MAMWGEVDIVVLAHELKRTRRSIAEYAKHLKLPAPSQQTKTLRALMRSSGYAESQIREAMARLGFEVHRVRRTDPKQHRFGMHWAVTKEQEAAILAFLSEHLKGRYVRRVVGLRTARGVWGIGKKPPTCLGCQSVEKPHYARGLCTACYQRRLKQKKRDEETI
jgi:hypothetical protein